MTSADDPRENDDYAENLPEIYTCEIFGCGAQFESKHDLTLHVLYGDGRPPA